MVILTRVQQEQELDADVVGHVEFELSQFVLQLVEVVGEAGHAEKAEAQQVELLSVVQHSLVGQAVVHALVQVVQHEHVRPRVLQQLHLVVDLQQYMTALLHVQPRTITVPAMCTTSCERLRSGSEPSRYEVDCEPK